MSIHPGLYRYNSPSRIEAALAQFETEYKAAADIENYDQLYLAMSRFLTKIRCGHSYANFFNQNDSAVTALFNRQTRLPFYFEWLNREMVVTKDHSGTNALQPGTGITHINGIKSSDLLARLLPYIRADGSNDGKRLSLLGVRGDETIETFDVFQGLLLPPTSGSYSLRIEAPAGRTRTLDVPAIDIATRRSVMTKVPENSDLPRWQWSLRGDNIAVLTMPGWAMWNSRWDWRTWLEERLDSLDGARGLIIDIRDNEGGDDCGDPILARLIDQDLNGWPFDARIRFKEVPEILSPHVSTWDESFRNLGVNARPIGDGFYARADEPARTPIRPATKRINVPVAALIGPTNSSATFSFINAARASGKVRLFGETTGGNRRGINGGAFFFTKLPYSCVVFDLPLIGYFTRDPQPDAGIDPDVRVSRTRTDIVTGRDRATEAAAQWIKRG